jgi:hypothetical protein
MSSACLQPHFDQFFPMVSISEGAFGRLVEEFVCVLLLGL